MLIAVHIVLNFEDKEAEEDFDLKFKNLKGKASERKVAVAKLRK